MVAVLDPYEADLPGELADEGTALDWVPQMAGCGRGLYTAAQILIGRAGEAMAHLEGCTACRNALAAVGDCERGASALAYFERLGTETPHAAGLAIAAA